MKKYQTIGTIVRCKPLHKGGAVMLETLCEIADNVKIGIGSVNKYNLRNPFSAKESENMINIYLNKKFSNYSIIFIEDSGHIPKYKNGKKWVQDIKKKFSSLDYFVTGNKYVQGLLKDYYKIIHPANLIPEEKQIMLKATQVRVEMAKNGKWQELVPKPVVNYLEKNKLVERFRQEFGLETLAHLSDKKYWMSESYNQEKANTLIV